MTRSTSNTPLVVCGLPKSGTTFLQRMLNLHPEISCPSEQSFKALRHMISQFLKYYKEEVLQPLDRRTGGQGVSEYGVLIENDMLRTVIITLSNSFARGRPIHGLNENSVFTGPEFYDNLLGRPKIIGIIRNPVDVGLSIWRHNKRLAKVEPSNAAVHLAILDNPKKSLEGFIEKYVSHYQVEVERFLEYAAARSNFLVVRYEYLVGAKNAELRRIFGFLGANAASEIVEKIIVDSTREAMAARSKFPAFFGLDPEDRDRVAVSREFRRAVLEAAMSPRLRELGYDISALMLGH